MANASRLQRADDETVESLVAKCQENGWLMRGGYAWQDDPYLEEYPYEFAKADSIEELRGFFVQGNFALRQGAVYEDLAFVQQVDGGDEWWDAEARWLGLGRLRELVLQRHREGARAVRACDRVHASRNPRAMQASRLHERYPSIEDAARRARDSIPQLNKTANPHSRNARAEVR